MKNLLRKIAFVAFFVMLLLGLLYVSGDNVKAEELRSGDDGITNWDFIEPVTHQETVPEGYIGIYTAQDLADIANDNDAYSSYILMNDIDLQDFGEWTPIGDNVTPFLGVFDGNGYVISNMTITQQLPPTNNHGDGMGGYINYGLFGVYYTEIKNLGVVNSNIDVEFNIDDEYGAITVGGIAGTPSYVHGNAKISNCYHTGNISVKVSTSQYHGTTMGGVAGVAPYVSSCYSDTSIILSVVADGGYQHMGGAGGVVGWTNYADKCFNRGSVTVDMAATSGDPNVWATAAGVVGSSYSHIVNSYNEGDITAIANATDTEKYYDWSDDTEKYYAITRAVASGIGNSTVVENCYNTGSLNSFATSNDEMDSRNEVAISEGIGNLVRLDDSVSLAREMNSSGVCQAFGDCTHIANSYASLGMLGGAEVDDTARLLPEDTFSDISFWRDTLGWDFGTTWVMPSDGGYPTLKVREEENLYIKAVDMPSDATISNEPYLEFDGTIKAEVSLETDEVEIQITPSIADATWTLSWINPDNNMQKEELSSKILPLDAMENYAYITLEADGFGAKEYLVTVTKVGIKEIDVPLKPENGIDSVRVKWGSELFHNKSSKYNKDLALVAATLNQCAYDNSEYLRGANGAYSKLGFTNQKYFNYDYNASDTTVLSGSNKNEHCFSIASQPMKIDGKEQLVVAVVLRGTTNWPWNEAIGDAIAVPNRDWHGYSAYNYYADFAEKVWEQFTNYVRQDFTLEYRDIKVVVAGHSLGGAAANLFAAKFKLNTLQNIVDVDDVYAFTFGALNSISEKDVTLGFGNIHNVFNFYDTFGVNGEGIINGFKPADGSKTIRKKFGNIKLITRKYTVGDYSNHNMTNYLLSVQDDVFEKNYRAVIACPVDVFVYNEDALVGKVVNNVVDTESTSIPMFVLDDVKFVSVPNDGKHKIEIKATDSGKMSYLIEDFDAETGGTTGIFENVNLHAGKTMVSELVGAKDANLVIMEDGNVIGEISEDGSETINDEGGDNPGGTPTPTPKPPTPTPKPPTDRKSVV